MDQKALGQSNCRIFKVTVSLEKKAKFLHINSTILWELKVD